MHILMCVASIFFVGCGGSSSGGSTSIATTTLAGTLTDGPISNATVVLASMKGGKLTQETTTDDAGNYSLTVSNAVINGLSDNDLPYIHAESTENSAVLTNGGQKSDLVKGQVSFVLFWR